MGAQVLEGGNDSADFKFIIIRKGLTKDGKRNYTEAALRDAADRGVYNGFKMYANHQGPQDKARGHRDERDWWSTIQETFYDEDEEALAGRAHAHDSVARGILADPVARAATEFSHDSWIRYARTHDKASPPSVPDVVKIDQANSVDWVPYGNAGGRVTEADLEDDDMTQEEIAALVSATVAEAIAPVVEQLNALVARKPEPEVLNAEPEPVPETPSPEPNPETEALRAENAALKHEKAVADTARLVEKYLDEKPLSPKQRELVLERFAGKDLPATEIQALVDAASEWVNDLSKALLLEAAGPTRIHGAPLSGTKPRAISEEEVAEKLNAGIRGILGERAGEILPAIETIR
jgi:hypothetical protein